MESGSDNDLMCAVRSGDVDKLGLLFERYKTALFDYFYRNTRCAEVSEDLVQNVFLRILKYKARFAGDGKFTTWMYHIAHNVYTDHFKKNRPPAGCSCETELEDRRTAEKLLLEGERMQLVEKALYRLSKDQREILVFSRYERLKYKEISEILGCSEGAVKVRIFRAIMNLKQIYSELEG
ncbi:MAG: RNA polymerase sigma factor [Candidatus Hydrogenedentota bacterium]|nr:MAG: RNA polymerase sigma factor [Candidatus Hydrogenedentota bacterium]